MPPFYHIAKACGTAPLIPAPWGGVFSAFIYKLRMVSLTINLASIEEHCSLADTRKIMLNLKVIKAGGLGKDILQ